jgi:hypothetical protein
VDVIFHLCLPRSLIVEAQKNHFLSTFLQPAHFGMSLSLLTRRAAELQAQHFRSSNSGSKLAPSVTACSTRPQHCAYKVQGLASTKNCTPARCNHGARRAMPTCSSGCDWWAFPWFLYVAASACTTRCLEPGPYWLAPRSPKLVTGCQRAERTDETSAVRPNATMATRPGSDLA